MSGAREADFFSGLVLYGSRNVFFVLPDGEERPRECRLKGKVLKDVKGFYNPIAPGDRVKAQRDPKNSGAGMIVALEERANFFSRYNQKGGSPQMLAANVDRIVCVTTRASPPFRPRFLDRVLLQADVAGINSTIVCNKIDLNDISIDADERLEDFKRLGYDLLEVSAKTGQGLEKLRALVMGKRTVFIGQSGVGKSSLLNALAPGLDIRTGIVNQKYDRGNHTTTLATMIRLCEYSNDFCKDTWVIDTPGMRLFVPEGIERRELISYLREFEPLAGKCSYGLSCSHRQEPGCKVMEAVHAGAIHEDRYESFLRISDELAEIKSWGKKDA
ncbi:MAG: ribosome small subunit-dependent GTPase A [Treponema sp.]|nr:ribosome small subunit-dependent GTPase A [Treponema sp.]